MDEAILKLIVDMGPESSGALQFYVIADLVGSVMALAGWIGLMYLVYLIVMKLIQVLAYDPGAPIRKITHPHATGPVSESEINDIVDVIEVWKVKAEHFDKQVNNDKKIKASFL